MRNALFGIPLRWHRGLTALKPSLFGLRAFFVRKEQNIGYDRNFFRKSKKSSLREVARIEKITESFG